MNNFLGFLKFFVKNNKDKRTWIQNISELYTKPLENGVFYVMNKFCCSSGEDKIFLPGQNGAGLQSRGKRNKTQVVGNVFNIKA